MSDYFFQRTIREVDRQNQERDQKLIDDIRSAAAMGRHRSRHVPSSIGKRTSNGPRVSTLNAMAARAEHIRQVQESREAAKSYEIFGIMKIVGYDREKDETQVDVRGSKLKLIGEIGKIYDGMEVKLRYSLNDDGVVRHYSLRDKASTLKPLVR